MSDVKNPPPLQHLRGCTCHPDDNPPVPCAERYAFSECVAASSQDVVPVAYIAPDIFERLKAGTGGMYPISNSKFKSSDLTVPLYSEPCPAVPEGYALVPIEPTRAMWAAMANTLYGYKNRHHDKVAGDLYKAMLAAAAEGSDND